MNPENRNPVLNWCAKAFGFRGEVEKLNAFAARAAAACACVHPLDIITGCMAVAASRSASRLLLLLVGWLRELVGGAEL